jgi:hypothetical protein
LPGASTGAPSLPGVPSTPKELLGAQTVTKQSKQQNKPRTSGEGKGRGNCQSKVKGKKKQPTKREQQANRRKRTERAVIKKFMNSESFKMEVINQIETRVGREMRSFKVNQVFAKAAEVMKEFKEIGPGDTMEEEQALLCKYMGDMNVLKFKRQRQALEGKLFLGRAP